MAEDLAGSTCFASCELGTASVENKVKYVCSAEEFVELSFYQFLIQCVGGPLIMGYCFEMPVILCKGSFEMKV